MCGFLADVSDAKLDIDQNVGIAELRHRGPDFSNSRLFEGDGVFQRVCHARLAIQNLSNEANQPLHCEADGSFIAYNGEIYNCATLVEIFGLDADILRLGDTHVLFALLRNFDASEILKQVEGMFAFYFYDGSKNQCVVARDKYGQKPLFFHQSPGRMIFASTMEAVSNSLSLDISVNQEWLAHYLATNFGATGHSLVNEIQQFPAAHYFVGKPLGPIAPKRIQLTEHRGLSENFETLFDSCVRDTMVADVPVGVFMSSGLDSSAVAIAANKVSATTTYTLAFETAGYSEHVLAEEFARRNGIEHETVFLSPESFRQSFQSLAQKNDMPFSDVSQVALHHLSDHVRDKTKVVLTGDGGDELFGGYNRVQLEKHPLFRFRRFYARALELSVGKKRIHKMVLGLLTRLNVIEAQARAEKLTKALFSKSELGFLRAVLYRDVSFFDQGEQKIDAIFDAFQKRDLKISDFDSFIYLTENCLFKSDRASMACGVELRAPYLDSRLKTFVQSQQEKPGKNLLLTYLETQSDGFAQKKKMGFTPPLNYFLTSSLAPQIAALRENNSRLGQILGMKRSQISTLVGAISATDADPHALYNLISLNEWLNCENRTWLDDLF